MATVNHDREHKRDGSSFSQPEIKIKFWDFAIYLLHHNIFIYLIGTDILQLVLIIQPRIRESSKCRYFCILF